MKNLATVIYLWGALLLGLTAGLSLIRQTPARAQLLAYTQIDYQASLAEVYLINRYGETLEALSQGQYWFPQWSPDGQQVIATSQLLYNRDLYRLESDFSRPFPLVFDFKNDWNPVWSPEGERVAFVSDRGGQNDIFLIQPQTLQVEQLTRDSNSNFEPSWSPGGDWIAFTSLRDVDLEVYKMRADGTEAQNLSQSPGDDGSPAWSPRGDWIAFASRRGGGPADIYRTRPEGGGTELLYSSPWEEWYLAWSPGGDFLAFASSPDGINWDLYLLEAATGEAWPLKHDPAMVEYAPAWLPIRDEPWAPAVLMALGLLFLGLGGGLFRTRIGSSSVLAGPRPQRPH